jgi:hypothetical protein
MVVQIGEFPQGQDPSVHSGYFSYLIYTIHLQYLTFMQHAIKYIYIFYCCVASYYLLNCVLHYLKVLTPITLKVIVFGYRVFKNIINLK